MTLEEAGKELGPKAPVNFGVSLVKRLAEAKKKEAEAAQPAQRNPSILHS